MGISQVEELGTLETPIVLTNTLSVFAAADAVIDYTLGQPGNEGVGSVNPVAGETNDGYLNDIRGRHVRGEHVLAAIRAAMPEGAFLTSEANAEVYAKWLDGFLVWHWQSDGMVPAFPAVYGGAVQMFGRSYWGEDGAVGEEALCAKAGQQLVFGEQLGWIYPWVVDRPSADFFRNLVQTRWLLRLYFYAGEMARPPRLEGEMPVVVSDWYWYGENWVTTDAVLTGAWHIPAERRLALFFVNVSDQPVTLTHRLNQDTYGISAAEVSRLTVVNGVPSGTQQLTLPLVEELHFAPRQVTAWELQW